MHQSVRSPTSSEDTKLKYLEKVKQCSISGEISPTGRTILNTFRLRLGLSPEEAAEIEDQVLRLFQKQLENLQQYRAAFAAEIKREFPLSQNSLALLEELQELLELKKDEVVLVEEEVVAETLKQMRVHATEKGLTIQGIKQELEPIENQLIGEIDSNLHPAINWIASQKDVLVERACREIQKEYTQLSEEELNDFTFQLGQYLKLIQRAVVARSNDLLQEPRTPLLANVALYVKALEFLKTRIPREMNNVAKAELENRLDHLKDRL